MGHSPKIKMMQIKCYKPKWKILQIKWDGGSSVLVNVSKQNETIIRNKEYYTLGAIYKMARLV